MALTQRLNTKNTAAQGYTRTMPMMLCFAPVAKLKQHITFGRWCGLPNLTNAVLLGLAQTTMLLCTIIELNKMVRRRRITSSLPVKQL